MNIALTGFLTGLSLIVAIGAQNAFVLRLGLMKSHIGVAVTICAVSDAVLIFVGTAGMGALVQANQGLLKAVSWVGAAYLLYFAFTAAKRVFTDQSMTAATQTLLTKKQVILSVLGFTWLNPHVYLDTVLLVGSIGSQYGAERWVFAIGAATASLLWFIGLGYGSKAAARVMARPLTWKILDIFIALVMTAISISLVRTALGN
jgi:L-lysine exporter family protein LysE/ArgO